MKKTINFLILLLCFAFVANAVADIRFVTPDLIIKDLPFPVSVEINSNGEQVARTQVYVTSAENNLYYSGGSQGEWLTGSTLNNNIDKESGLIWWYNIGPKGSISSQSSNFVRLLTLSARGSSDAIIKLTDADNLVAKYPSGESILYNVIDKSIVPQFSTCGDGIVDYFDPNQTGREGEHEACDNSTSYPSGAGCIECRYIDYKSYKVTGDCSYGSRSCSLTLKEPIDILRGRISALMNGQCYPSESFPLEKDYCNNGQPVISYPGGKLNGGISERIYLVAQISAALQEYFSKI